MRSSHSLDRLDRGRRIRALAHRRHLIEPVGTSAGRRSPVEPCAWADSGCQAGMFGGSGLSVGLQARLVAAVERRPLRSRFCLPRPSAAS
jgi:hypothetical protein